MQGVEAPDGSTVTLARFRFAGRKGQKNNLLHFSDCRVYQALRGILNFLLIRRYS
jgi:hypothetical protein